MRWRCSFLITRAGINDYASQKLAKFKLPKSYDVAQAFPMNATGKILKRELRKQYWSDKDRQVG